MKKILFEVTDELADAINRAAGGKPINPQLEYWLWQTRAIQKAAKELGIKEPKRPTRGRPRKDEE